MTGFFELITDLDQSLFFFLNGKHSPFWDIVMTLFTRTEYWLILYVPLIWFIIKKYRAKALVILILLALAIVITDQFSVLVKDTVKRFRPTHDPAIQHLVHNVLKKGGLYGFFSSHASNTFGVAAFTSLLFRNSRYSFLIYSWALLVSYTRIYVGVHYPLDILTGMLFGILTGYFMYKLLIVIEKHFLVLRSPKLEETNLENSGFNLIFIIFLTVLATTFMVVSRLQHFNWI
ncbi:phosphatase PAP2 family protein [Gaoshiqia sp. Z1-71]|uniref:phosphatase PAP2 family protein n=1 Tax=Gaoshiqia hydrogeniformans TaxID=3290090 RepID=UPI003BF897F7